MKKNMRSLLGIGVFVAISTISVSSAHAEFWAGTGGGSSGGGGGGSSYNCTSGDYSYAISCAGTSWIKYEPVTTDYASIPAVTFPGITNGIDTTIPKTCAKSGFWHYGINMINGEFADGVVSLGTANSYTGHWQTINSGYTEVDPYNTPAVTPNQKVGGYYVAKKYGSKEDVLKNYNKALSRNNMATVSDLPSDLWAFCDADNFTDNSNPDYYTTSNVIDYDGPKSWDSTGAQNTVTRVTTSKTVIIPENATSTEVVPVVFSHNIYTKDANPKAKNVGFTVTRTSNGGSEIKSVSGKYSVQYDSSTTSSGLIYSTGTGGSTSTGRVDIDITKKDKVATDYYGVKDRRYTDGNYMYVLRDKYNITFHDVGTYRFCEKMQVDGTSFYTESCAEIMVVREEGQEPGECGSWTPASYTSSNANSGTTSVVAKVRNETLGEGFGDSTYAKPTDKVSWINCYYPGMQTVANTYASTNHNDSTELAGTSYTVVNRPMSTFGSWNNSYRVSGTNFSSTKFKTYSGPYGDTTIMQTDVPYTVQYGGSNGANNKTGNNKILVDTISVNSPVFASVTWQHATGRQWACHRRQNEEKCGTHEVCSYRYVWKDKLDDDGNKIGRELVKEAYNCHDVANYCYVDTCTHLGDDYISNSRTGTASDSADVKVPYNFYNATTIELANDIVYSGETVAVNDIKVIISPRTNNSLRGTYSTNVDGAQVKVIGYLSSDDAGDAVPNYSGSNLCGGFVYKERCDDLRTTTTNLNIKGYSIEDVFDDIGDLKKSPYDVYDDTPGQYFCVRSAVFPASSGETDYQMNASGSGTWYISKPSCALIAKRPSFQLWGGSLYSAGTVNAAFATKTNLKDVSGFGYNSGNKLTFGSWAEIGVTSFGQVNGLASGAATGKNDTAAKYGNQSGGCALVPLSLANSSCGRSGESGELGNNAPTISRASLLSYVEGISEVESCNIFDIGNSCGIESTGGITGTKVVKASGNVRIEANVEYTDTSDATKLDDIPKLIIYAKNIEIACSVTRIDAILIAEETVDTCSKGAGEHYDNSIWKDDVLNDELYAPERSNPLRINGMIITDQLLLNRTYGAGTGVASGIPAEIINYDSSAILWGEAKADVSESNTLNVTYLHELPPRY